MEKIEETLRELIEEGEKLAPQGGNLFEGYNGRLQPEYLAWRIQALDALKRVGPQMKLTLRELESDKHSAYFFSNSAENILGGLKGALALLARRSSNAEHDAELSLGKSKKTFVVHGREETLLPRVARFLEKLRIEPIILAEQPGEGRTIIEKLEEYSNVAFAIILLTPDDVGRLASKQNESLRPRARQNVVLELGYFLGKLGRQRVTVLYETSIDLPSNYRGVEYIPLDKKDAWQLGLAREMKAAGLPIDLNKLV